MINIYIQIPYYNKHITPIFDSLSKFEQVTLKVGLLEPGEKFRKGYDWDNEIDHNLYIKLWQNKEDIVSYIDQADIYGVHGFFSFHDNYKLILKGLKRNKKILIFSEGLKKRGMLNNFVKSIFIRRINNEKIHFFELGHNAFLDYQLKGATNWNYHEFGYSVDPVDQSNQHDYHKKLRLIYVGQLIKRKRPKDILNTLTRCDKTKFSLDIFGDGELKEEMVSMVDQLGLSNNVFFHGIQSRAIITQSMLDADCLILPSEYDGWGAVVNEAMECGLVVIVSSGVRAKSILDEKFIYQTGSIDQLEAKINSLIASPTLVKETKILNKERIVNYRPYPLAQLIFDTI